jgi:purine-cytosine permease-like protein
VPHAGATADDDHTRSIVPGSLRRSNRTMFLLWVTLQASISIVYTGYLARSQGLSLGQLMGACAIAAGAIFVYGVGAANIGAATGQMHTLLARTIFGKAGSGIVSVLLIIMGMGWYGFQARFLVDMLGGIVTISNPTLWAVGFAIVMIANNLFGFRGVATYARFVAAPLLLLWGAYALVKGFAKVPSDHWFSSPHVAQTTTILTITGLIIGSAAWGNEPDIFRYSKTRPFWNVPTLLSGYVIGAFLFPIAGYLMAELSSATDLGPTMKYFVDFSLFGLTALAVVLFFVNQFALNDGNLYEAVNAVQNLAGWHAQWRRVYSVLLLGAIGAVLAWKMQSLESNFFIVANISAILVPSATTIMAVDYFVLPRLLGVRRTYNRVVAWHEAAFMNWIAILALAVGAGVGCYTGGLIPYTSAYDNLQITGFPALQAWLLSAGIYLGGAALAVRSPAAAKLLGHPTEHALAGERALEPAIGD